MSEDQQQLTRRTQQQQQQQQQPQHPLPPKQQQPLCRSPSVNMRAPASVPALLCGLSGQLQQPNCSLVPEQRQQTPLSNASSVDYRSLLQLGAGSDFPPSWGGTPAGTPLLSTGRYPPSLGPPSAGTPAAAPGAAHAAASSSGRASGGARQMPLPPPAFQHLLNMGLNMPLAPAPAAAAGSANCSPEGAASAPAARPAHDSRQQSPQQHQPSSLVFQQIRRSISTPTAGGSAGAGGASDAATGHPSSSGGKYIAACPVVPQQQQQVVLVRGTAWSPTRPAVHWRAC
ncbi:hypothetical protein COO60DRAFT_603605 [Scenedesmus sp. NREL 46B-D3]|nr:hypothetical protein COO60DRAFT_603605 [Scenedesmus sp. NREL 46B-D3]